MKKCKTCKHWAEDKYGVNVLSGQCENPKNQMRAGERRNYAPREIGPTDCIPWDASDYSAGLETMPDFGCVNHEGRDK